VDFVVLHTRLVVLESGLGLESGLKSVFAGLGLGLGLGGSASKSFFQVLCTYKIDTATAADQMGEHDIEETVDVDDPESWEELLNTEMGSVNNTIDANAKNERLSCFCHSLYLTVSDGLKDTKCLSSAIAKACKLTSLVHQSQIFRDEFEQAFRKNNGIPAAVCTR